MKKLFISMLVLLLLCGCEKGAEVYADISEISKSVTTTKAAEVVTNFETTVTTVETI
ncbi:MAG: hypothetical protein K2J76_03890 [Oscillospiraceae bacterium]|nr:hypothetical protein [Oscillospiraceae bacterium]